MTNKKVADHYDRVYSDDDRAFTGEPLPLVKLLTEYLPKGKVLEIAAGAGRNALFLASKGYEVHATDISPVATEKLAQKARELGVALGVDVSDIAQDELNGSYDAIICTFAFHHLTRSDARIVIEKIQRYTKPQGFNVLTVFTKNGDFYKSNPDTENFYLQSKEELENMYSGWNLIKSFEKEGKARALNTEGKPQFNIFAGLLAQKR